MSNLIFFDQAQKALERVDGETLEEIKESGQELLEHLPKQMRLPDLCLMLTLVMLSVNDVMQHRKEQKTDKSIEMLKESLEQQNFKFN